MLLLPPPPAVGACQPSLNRHAFSLLFAGLPALSQETQGVERFDSFQWCV